jgi:prephenate dehydrogenase
MIAAALINANSNEDLRFAGKGFMDTSRVASGPANIWADVLLTNTKNASRGIDKVIAELTKLKEAIKGDNKVEIEKLLEKARDKRTAMINYKMEKKEIIE